MTYGEMLKAACACKDEAAARVLVDKLVAERKGGSAEKSRQIILENIGYGTGYLDRADARRILAIFHTEHPIFGSIENWPKTAQESFDLGQKVAEVGLAEWRKRGTK